MSMIPALIALAAAAQPLPKGTALPPPTGAEGEVIATVDALFAGLAARDAQAIGAALRPDATATVANEGPGGARRIIHMTRAELLSHFQPGPERYEERLLSPAVEVDGDIAMVWGRYVFLIDGKLHHCGVDHFDLVREAGAWKIQNLTWSSRTEGCEAGA